VIEMGMRGVYAKLAHAGRVYDDTVEALKGGWADAWWARGGVPLGWIWAEGDPIAEARQAVDFYDDYNLAGIIVNAEGAYEDGGAWKSRAFVDEFRRLAPHAPLAVSFIGFGYPYRNFDYAPWVEDGAALLPQAYNNVSVITVRESLEMCQRAGLPMSRVMPTIGSSYSPRAAIAEAVEAARSLHTVGMSLWMVQGGATNDDYIREFCSKARTAGVVAA
jgi:hypothetical protein